MIKKILALMLFALLLTGCSKVKEGDWYEDIASKKRFKIFKVYPADSVMIIYNELERITLNKFSEPGWDSVGVTKPEEVPNLYKYDRKRYIALNQRIIDRNRKYRDDTIESLKEDRQRITKLVENNDELYLLDMEYYKDKNVNSFSVMYLTKDDLEKNFIKFK